MRAPIFIGDRVSAAGFRLGGLETRVPEPGDEERLFRRTLQEAELVVVTADVAAALPERLVREALAAGSPAVLIVPDVRGRVPAPDLGDALKRQLGVAE